MEIIESLQEFIDDGDEELSYLIIGPEHGPDDIELVNELIEDILAYGNEEDADEDEDGGNILHYAVDHQWANAIPNLVKVGVDVNGADNLGRTPLMIAAMNAMDPFGVDTHAMVPDPRAVAASNAALKLIEAGADVRKKDSRGLTALHYAVKSNAMSLVEKLVEMGADVNAKDAFSQTPMHSAGSADAVQYLAKHGADVNAKDSGGVTPLLSVVIQPLKISEEGTIGAMSALLELGANPYVRVRDGARGPEHTVAELIEEYGTEEQTEVLDFYRDQRGEVMDEVEKVAIRKGLPADVSEQIKQFAVPLPPKPKGENPIVFDGQTVIDFFDITTMNNPLKLQSAIMTAIDTLNRSKTAKGVAEVVKTLEGLKTESEGLKSLSVHYQRKKMEEIRKKIDEVKATLRKIIDENRVRGGRRKTHVKKVKRRQTYRKRK